MANLLLVDENPIVQSVLKFLIQENFTGFNIDEANDQNSSIEKIRTNVYDLVLLDVNITRKNSIQLVNSMLAIQPSLKILMFGLNHEQADANSYFKTEVMGYMANHEPEKEIKAAIETILSNKKYVSPKLIHLCPGHRHKNKSCITADKLLQVSLN